MTLHDSFPRAALALAIIDQSADFIGISTPQGRTVQVNRAGLAMAGLPDRADVGGRRFLDFFAQIDGQFLEDHVWSTLITKGRWVGELRLQRSDTGHLIPVEVDLFAVKDQAGQVLGFATIMRDLSERNAAEERQKLLLREAHHRAQNTLATVIAIISVSARSGRGLKQRQRAVINRIVALGNANALLTENYWRGVWLHDLLARELDPFSGEGVRRVSLNGPALELRPEIGTGLAMVIHELATNAVKHGALSRSTGKVDVTWRLAIGEPNDPLLLDWIERDGPPVRAPSRLGFGSLLLSRIVNQQIKGRISIDFERSGLRAMIQVPSATHSGWPPR
jgi:PAS domain S-box-containing protein